MFEDNVGRVAFYNALVVYGILIPAYWIFVG